MSLPQETQAALNELPVIDYGYYEPKETKGVAVMTILVKTTDSPLAPTDLRYMADVWGGIGEALQAEPGNLKKDAYGDNPWATEPPF